MVNPLAFDNLFPHFDIPAETRSRMSTATTFSRQNDSGSRACTAFSTRDFKIQRRGRQRERQKNNCFNYQNNNFSRASHFFVLFFPAFERLRRENA